MTRDRASLVFLRMVVAGLLLLHGVARVVLGIVGDFGLFLGEWGFPFPLPMAWLITGVEIAGSVLLALGLYIRPLALWFAAELGAGIVLVHATEGWFVVGAGRNGMEYSVLLIMLLVSIAYSTTTSPVEAGPFKPQGEDDGKS